MRNFIVYRREQYEIDMRFWGFHTGLLVSRVRYDATDQSFKLVLGFIGRADYLAGAELHSPEDATCFEHGQVQADLHGLYALPAELFAYEKIFLAPLEKLHMHDALYAGTSRLREFEFRKDGRRVAGSDTESCVATSRKRRKSKDAAILTRKSVTA